MQGTAAKPWQKVRKGLRKSQMKVLKSQVMPVGMSQL